MSLLVKKEGILSTIQDPGRIGYRRFGINPSGVMDQTSARLINYLLGNDANAPVIEVHYPVGLYEFEQECLFAIGGADFCPKLNGQAIRRHTIVSVSADDVLSFGSKVDGNRAYLAIRGGFRADCWLGSTSTNLRAS
ncbi:MAG TPA: hypothetical protein VEV84_00750, partial [Pyrinomonadaceae bacterium]|nr:hypothetical protein [Pyrinomonadaceae bacterium]